MPITFGPSLANYTDLRYKVILDLEENGQLKPGVYVDGRGFATIGMGFLVGAHAEAILRGMGYDGDPNLSTYVLAIQNAVAPSGQKWFASNFKAQTALDDALRAATGNATAQFRFDFYTDGTPIEDPAIVDTRIRQTFEAIVPSYETQRVNAWLPDPNLINIQSFERLALLSLAYNNLVGINVNQQGQFVSYKSPKLRQAILDDNRAEAWFQIRYNSNKEGWTYINSGQLGPNARGHAKRRFEEAALFGLYNPNFSLPSPDEAKQIYRMLQVHRTAILDYENAFGKLPYLNMAVAHYQTNQGDRIAAARTEYPNLTGLPQPDYLVDALNPAKDAYIADLVQRYPILAGLAPGEILSTAIFFGDPGRANTLSSVIYYRDGNEIESSDILEGGNAGNVLTAGKGNDVLIGGTKVDRLDGGPGIDVLIGGTGNDRLEGGPGADILIGGADQDTYVWRLGETPAEDTIIDEDEQGFFAFTDSTGKLTLISGEFIKDPTDPTRWVDLATGEIFLTNNSPWTIILPDGSAINLGESFDEGDFGIQLLDAPADPQLTGDPIVGDLTPVEPEQYDALGNLVVDPNLPAPDRADVLNGRDVTTEGDLIQSKGGDDVVAAKKGDDKIEAGTGSDIVNAGEGNDLVLGGADLDLLWGLEGNDRLYADTEIDLQTAIAQGESDLPTGSKGELMDGGEGEDILVGGPGNDALVGGGGTGANVILGGAGDDLILGHVRITTAAREWTVTRTVQQGAGGTQYLWGFNNATAEQDSTPSDDALYGGQGIDWLFGGPGNDQPARPCEADNQQVQCLSDQSRAWAPELWHVRSVPRTIGGQSGSRKDPARWHHRRPPSRSSPLRSARSPNPRRWPSACGTAGREA